MLFGEEIKRYHRENANPHLILALGGLILARGGHPSTKKEGRTRPKICHANKGSSKNKKGNRHSNKNMKLHLAEGKIG